MLTRLHLLDLLNIKKSGDLHVVAQSGQIVTVFIQMNGIDMTCKS